MAKKRSGPEPAPRRPGRKEGKYRVLTPEEWLQARDEWEEDERKSAAYIATKWGIGLKTVKDRITRENWIRRIHKQLAVIPKPRPPWRPTIYREHYPELLLKFFAQPTFVVVGQNTETGAVGIITQAYACPTMERFAASIGVHRQRLHEWSTEKDANGLLRHPDFADAYARAKTIQAANIIEGGMSGAYNTQFAMLAARNLIGWRQDPEHEEEVTEDYPDQAQLRAIYNRGIEQKNAMRQKILERRARAAAAPQPQAATGK